MAYNKCTNEIVDKALNLINNHKYTIKDAAKELNIYYRTLLNHIVKHPEKKIGWKGKKDINSNYFNVIDTEHKAYWLGFLTADGYLSNKGTVELSLAEKDGHHVALLKQDLESDHKINEKRVQLNGKIFKQHRISFTDQIIASDLRRYGFTAHKTFDAYIPFDYIPKDLLRHYIRGLFDGDGSVGCYQGRLCVLVACTASRQMGNDLISCLFDNDISSTYSIDKRSRNVYSINVNKTREIQRLFRWMYSDATIYLERKYNIFAVSDQIAWRPEMISAELSGETGVK